MTNPLALRCSLSALLLAAPAAASGQARPASGEHPGHAQDPQFAPGGDRISYEVTDSAAKETKLYVRTLGSGQEEALAPPASAGGLGGRFGGRARVDHELAWSPTGQLYAFASTGSAGDFDLFLQGVSMPLGGPDKQGGATFSSDTRYLAYCSAQTGDGDLYLLDVFALEQPPRQLTRSPGLDFYATWSPVAPRLAYTGHGEQGAGIRVLDDATGEGKDRVVADGPGDQIKPSWSPDGSQLAFYSSRPGDEGFDLWVVPAGGGEARRLLERVVPGERRGPAWTPDGREVVAVRNDPNGGDPLVRVRLDGVVTTLPTGTVNNAEPTVWGKAGAPSYQVAFVAQGARDDREQGWRKVYVTTVRP